MILIIPLQRALVVWMLFTADLHKLKGQTIHWIMEKVAVS